MPSTPGSPDLGSGYSETRAQQTEVTVSVDGKRVIVKASGTGDKPFQCPVRSCSKCFGVPRGLQRHCERIHAVGAPGTFDCMHGSTDSSRSYVWKVGGRAGRVRLMCMGGAKGHARKG